MPTSVVTEIETLLVFRDKAFKVWFRVSTKYFHGFENFDNFK